MPTVWITILLAAVALFGCLAVVAFRRNAGDLMIASEVVALVALAVAVDRLAA